MVTNKVRIWWLGWASNWCRVIQTKNLLIHEIACMDNRHMEGWLICLQFCHGGLRLFRKDRLEWQREGFDFCVRKHIVLPRKKKKKKIDWTTQILLRIKGLRYQVCQVNDNQLLLTTGSIIKRIMLSFDLLIERQQGVVPVNIT